MPIPESQLSRWSDHGAQDASKRTHEAIRRVLDAHVWPPGMTCDFYLQGSYRNDTNIRGDSDVDVVLELTSAFRHDANALPQYQQGALASSFSSATYDWDDFRRETLKALEGGFGKHKVAQGNKSIKLQANPPRLAADVVVCMKHRRYFTAHSYLEGITFWALRDKRWIVNYPKEHYKNGAAKSARTWDRYKRTVSDLPPGLGPRDPRIQRAWSCRRGGRTPGAFGYPKRCGDGRHCSRPATSPQCDELRASS